MSVPFYNSIVFLHIPKAAGTTLQQIIRKQYRSHEGVFYHHQRIHNFFRLPEDQRKKIKIFTGHFSFGLHVHQYLAHPTAYVTILRNPVERVISTYFYILRTPGHTHYQTTKNLSLYDFVKNGVSQIGIDNGMTRLLCGIKDGASIPFGECTEAMLESAKTNLSRYFSVVGLTKRFDETVLLLNKLFGWNPFYIKENVTARRPSRISMDTIELIKKNNKLGIELYNYAEALFDNQLKSHIPLLDDELNKFRFLNSIYKINRINPLFLFRTRGKWGLMY